MASMRIIPSAAQWFLSLCLLALLFPGCAHAGRKAAGETQPAPESGQETTTGTATPAAAPQPVDQQVEQMGFWLDLAVPPGDLSEGAVVFKAHGFRVTRLEYEAGLRAFLGEEERTPEAEERYHEQLRNQFLVLRWLAGNDRDGGNPEFRARARQELRKRVAELAMEEAMEPVTVSEEELRELYEQRREEFREPERVHVRMILVPTKEVAEEIMALLEEGESFSTLARERSRHESRYSYGELEPFTRGTYNKDFEEKAFALSPGDTGVVSSAPGTFIIEKLSNVPAGYKTFNEVKAQLRRELLEKKRRERREAFLGRVRSELP